MDLDAFAHENAPMWRRLDQLSRKPRRRLTPAEVDELITLYQRASTHLSMIRSRTADPLLVTTLSRLVQRARGAITPASGFSPAAVVRFFLVTFPLAVYRSGAWCLAVAVAFLGVAVALGAIVVHDPTIADALIGREAVNDLVSHEFENYYSAHPPANFATLIWLNNAWVTALSLAAGVLIVPTLWMLWLNAFNVGVEGGVMIAYGRGDLFFGLITVHGLLELTCIFVGAGVGMRVGWAWIAPGRTLTRAAAIAAAGRSAGTVALGLILPLGISGLNEAFVTPSPLLVPVKLAIGTILWLGFLAYVIVLGRNAANAGESADVAAFERDVVAPTV